MFFCIVAINRIYLSYVLFNDQKQLNYESKGMQSECLCHYTILALKVKFSYFFNTLSIFILDVLLFGDLCTFLDKFNIGLFHETCK